MADEKQLIYVNALVKDLELLAKHEDSFRQSIILGVVQTVKAQPTVDAVEVVRCKDCKYWGQDVCGYSGDDESFCTNPDGLDNYAHPDDFCSYGERKEGAD